jgi:hypothetical protein
MKMINLIFVVLLSTIGVLSLHAMGDREMGQACNNNDFICMDMLTCEGGFCMQVCGDNPNEDDDAICPPVGNWFCGPIVQAGRPRLCAECLLDEDCPNDRPVCNILSLCQGAGLDQGDPMEID